MYLFSKQSQFRIFCYKLTMNRRFSTAITLTVCFSIIGMIFETYTSAEDEVYNLVLSFVTLVTNIIILIDALINIISEGFILDNGSFMRDIWNGMNFVYLVSYFFSLVFYIPHFNITLYFRYFRPLKLLEIVKGIKEVKEALYQSIPDIISISLLLFSVW